MKPLITFLTGMVLVINTMAQDSTALSHPESVISDGKFLYVTNIGKALDPGAKDGDGYISKLSLDGKVIERTLNTTKLNAPKGTAIIRGMLYVADIDRVVGFEMATGKQLVEINLSPVTGSNFVNDLTTRDDFTLFASCTDVGKIAEVNIRTGYVRVIADVKGANGITYDKATSRLYTCSFDFQNMQGGELGVITWKNKLPVYEKLGDVHGAFDGLALLDDHTLVVSDWGAMDHPAGFVEKVDLKTNKVTKLDWPLISGPADFYLNASEKKIFIPALVEGKLVIQQL
jgi:DNA-binding beta-propeller fold protein YncE